MPAHVTEVISLCLAAACTALAGSYTQPGVNGYIDPNTWRHCDPDTLQARLNPIFRAWAVEVVEYAPSDQTWSGNWDDPTKALGPVTGSFSDIVSLGELTQEEILQGASPGYITLLFGDPNDPNDDGAIRNVSGYDFVVFENGMISGFTTSLGSFYGQLLAELAYVEVSSNGVDFARFPAVSLTSEPPGAYGTIDMSNVHNLAGMHPNAYGICTGTSFDLEELAGHPSVISGRVDLNDIQYVRLVDVPGSGDFLDDAVLCVDPDTGPDWLPYAENHPIYDQWPTRGSGGFDLEAVGVLYEQRYAADINLDGVVDHCDLSLLTASWRSQSGQQQWNDRCDLSSPRDRVVDSRDFAIFAAQWQRVEPWRIRFQDE